MDPSQRVIDYIKRPQNAFRRRMAQLLRQLCWNDFSLRRNCSGNHIESFPAASESGCIC